MLRRLLPALLLAASARAQPADSLVVDLGALEVEATRAGETAATAPLAVAVELRGPAALATEPGVALEPVLRALPGLWVSDRENFALGERLSVRGMGARAGFGVRGVQVVLDGVPLTMPDGQAALTIVDPALVRRAELVRGPASAFWGNGSGGVLLLGTIPDEAPLARARFLGGAFGMVKAEAEAAVPLGAHRAGLALSHTRREGYREHSAFEVTRARGFGAFELGRGAALAAVGALEWAPEQQNPGALTAEELAQDRRQAQASYVSQAAGKDVLQGQLGAALRVPLALGTLTAGAFGLARHLENPLPFAVIDLERLAGGARVALEREDGPLRWGLGLEAGLQRDERLNWANEGGRRGERRLDQRETVAASAAFAQAAYRRGPLTLSAGLRLDRTRFEAEDALLADGDHSGRRVLAAWSPSAGASYRLGPALLFVSAGTAFETPTTTELANRPDGAGGFNPEIGPQRTRGLEAGLRATTAGGRLFLDLAAYRLGVRDQLTAFEGEDGRTYYRNAEASTHAGLEALAEWRPARALRLGATYAWTRLRFSAGDLTGRHLPGVPEHRLHLRARLAHRRLLAHAELLAAGPTWADDANTARADGFAVLDLRLGHEGIAAGSGLLVQPFVQLQNALGARYVGSVNLNASGGRYFEPAAGRALVAGLSLRLDA